MSRYMRVHWHHGFDEEPVCLYSEVEAGREVRKVEVYRDEHMDFADERISTGTTLLSETLMPTVDEIFEEGHFTPELITREEFENIWEAAKQDTR